MESIVKVLENSVWACRAFEECDFGDPRRTKRVVGMAEEMLNAPDQSLPSQFTDWADLKAAYRFCDNRHVNFDAICTPHWNQTRQTKPGRYLLISDTTDIDFTGRASVEGLGMLGNGTGLGFQLHPCLVYSLDEKQVVGLAGALTYYRSFRPKNETSTERLARSRESEIWGKIVNQVGAAPEGAQWIHVFDRGGDHFEAICHIKLSGNDWVIRASRLNRNVINTAGDKVPLSAAVLDATELGTFTMDLRSTPRHAARTAKLRISFCEVQMPAPRHKSPWLKQCPIQELPMRVVIAEEMNTPKGNKPIRWIILTSLKVKSFKDAWEVLEFYEHRWMIEEYNRVLKSGCKVEMNALRTAKRLEAMVALSSIIAVRLFQLKYLGRNQPETKAASHVPSIWLRCLKLMRPKIKLTNLTVYHFFRELAKLGGFLARKHDGEPGWQTVWRGYQKMQQTLVGIELAEGYNAPTCG